MTDEATFTITLHERRRGSGQHWDGKTLDGARRLVMRLANRDWRGACEVVTACLRDGTSIDTDAGGRLTIIEEVEPSDDQLANGYGMEGGIGYDPMRETMDEARKLK